MNVDPGVRAQLYEVVEEPHMMRDQEDQPSRAAAEWRRIVYVDLFEVARRQAARLSVGSKHMYISHLGFDTGAAENRIYIDRLAVYPQRQWQEP